MSAPAEFTGPLETGTFPHTLRARSVTPGSEPRLHGYEVELDLAHNYRFSELIYLALAGELPNGHVAAALDVALAFAAPVSVEHASVHAGVLARLCGASTATTLGVASTGLGEHARCELDESGALFIWLSRPSRELPSAVRARSDAERASVQRLRAVLAARSFEVPGLELDPGRSAALLLVLHACGLTRREQLEALLTIARLPCALSEAFAERVANFREYPVNLPRYRYQEAVK